MCGGERHCWCSGLFIVSNSRRADSNRNPWRRVDSYQGMPSGMPEVLTYERRLSALALGRRVNPAPEGASNSVRIAVSLKRYPDTNPTNTPACQPKLLQVDRFLQCQTLVRT